MIMQSFNCIIKRPMWSKMNLDAKRWQMQLLVQLLGIALLATGQHAFAGCEPAFRLEGTIFIECCTPREKCISAAKAVYDYSVAAKDVPGVISVSMQASPWHFYDGQMRILTVEEVAETMRPLLRNNIKRIDLIASWTGVAPDPNGKSLAQKLSDALNGFPVKGMDGFVWLAKDGSVRTTQQAFTLKRTCPYGVHPGDEVLISLVEGWFIEYEEGYIKKQNAEGILHAGVGWDIFGLCPERALQSFETAAKLSNPIAAYNAALIRLERGKKGDLEVATSFFRQSATLGDKKAKERLQKLEQKGR